MSVHQYTNFDALPQAARIFLNAAGENNFFDSIPWFQTLLTNASPPDDQLCVFVAENAEQPTAALVAKRRNEAGALRSRMLLSPSHRMYTSLYGPILQDGSNHEGLREIVRTIVQVQPSFHVLRFDSLERGSPDFNLIVKEFRSSGMMVQPFFHFNYWFDRVFSKSVDEYLAGRSAQTQDLIRERARRIHSLRRERFELITGGPRLAAALVDYELVDLQSSNAPEPYPYCTQEIVRCAARAGALRLGLLYVDEEPAAAQIWIVGGGTATILRLRYASKFADLAVETVLTYEMFRYVIENDCIQEIGFAGENDLFETTWFESCRERFGLLVFNPRTVKGCLIAWRHVGGHILMKCARKLRTIGHDVTITLGA